MAKNKSKLEKEEEKLAYKLLLPALLIMFLIAFYPFMQVFITSLTDARFASARETSFVGLDNYKGLLSITAREAEPIIDEDTGEQKVDEGTGAKVYERPIDILPRDPHRYRELTSMDLFGNRYIIGARDPDFIKAVGNTLYFTVVSVFLETVFGLIIALVVNSKFIGRGAMRAVMLVPWAVITVVSARMWEFMLASNRTGLFNTLFNLLGFTDGRTNFLTRRALQIPSLIAIDVWKTTPFMALLILAGLQMIPNDLYEAAEMDGANKLKQFFYITLPLIKPSLAVALIFRTLDALRVFDIFQVILGSRRYSMASYNYYELINAQRAGVASAVGVIIFIIIAVFAAFYIKTMTPLEGDM